MEVDIMLLYFILILNIVSIVIILLMLKNTSQTRDKLIRLETLQQQQIHTQDLLTQQNQQIGQQLENNLRKSHNELKNQLLQEANQQRSRFDEYQLKSLKTIQESLQKNMTDLRQQISTTLNQHTLQINQRMESLSQVTEKRLAHISETVEQRLNKGFEKTTETFTDIIKRLAIIDQAQQKITELSSNVVNLQEILNDKRTRGAFGEVQLTSLIRNILPEQHFRLQYTLSNEKRADCILFLPPPTGNVVIDAKFPLENYQRLQGNLLAESDRLTVENQFKKDIKKHINDISDKYIIANETADGAVMFIPAEAVFAEIHGRYPELVEFAQKKRVWLVSPTTLMAILTTARAVLKDDATKQQVHIIQKHLGELAKDFNRFQDRMDKLSRHINQAQTDVELVHKSSQKISSRFNKIEQVEFQQHENPEKNVLPSTNKEVKDD